MLYTFFVVIFVFRIDPVKGVQMEYYIQHSLGIIIFSMDPTNMK